jgi:hypothetical protein
MPDSTDGGETASVAPLDAAARYVLKGTLVPLRIQSQRGQVPSHGLVKYGGVRAFALVPGETDAVREHLEMFRRQEKSGDPYVSDTTFALLRSFEAPIVPALAPNLTAVAAIPEKDLTSFAETLVHVRAQRVRAAQESKLHKTDVGKLIMSLNTAVAAVQSMSVGMSIQPIGMLNLERIEMAPAGIQRGELVATIPLAPGEETAVTHKEWSVTSKEFTTIVTDSLEQISETGVTDNTDLSQSTTSQTQHSTQFNITGTVQGGIPMISGSSTAGVTAQDAGSQSATESVKHATSITEKASSRSRQEHKTTISTTTVTGTSETSTRVLKNTSTTDPMRIDYFSLMRKWQVRLYRFGLRLTYDIVVPEPGAAMRRAYVELEWLRAQLGPFVFNVKSTDISPEIVDQNGNPASPGGSAKPKYLWLSDRFGVVVKPYPADPAPIFRNVTGAGSRSWSYLDLAFHIPGGSRIRTLFLSALVGNDTAGDWPWLRVMGARNELAWQDRENLEIHDEVVRAQDGSEFMRGATGDQTVKFWLWRSDSPAITLKVVLETTPETIEQWRSDVWTALYNAAQTRYFAQQQEIVARIGAIEQQLTNVDTLTLRREESDEIMKCVLKFVLGTGFDFMPPNVQAAFAAEGTDLAHGIAFSDQSLSGLNATQWTVLRQHEEMVRFINQAIEWENVVTFIYSYFWDIPLSWEFIRKLRHPDSTRQAFLRAGSARVVLTVRKGWEAKWLQFTETGVIDAEVGNPTTGPYLSIAQEIAAYDDRNYPGIPPANPAKAAVRLHDAIFTTASVKAVSSGNPVSIEVADSTGFVVGLQVVVDVEDDRHIQESVAITDVPDATHVVVASLTHTHDGTKTPFPMLQPGDRGTLIAEWNEYTPSSGIDIAVTSNLATIV